MRAGTQFRSEHNRSEEKFLILQLIVSLELLCRWLLTILLLQVENSETFLKSGIGIFIGCLDLTSESKVRKGGRSMQELKQTSGGSEAANVPRPTPAGAQLTTTAANSSSSSKPPPSRIQYFLNSGSKKHVFVGLLLVSAVACTPWFLLTSGSKHQNHADYMDQAEKARQSRLSSSPAQSETK